MLYRGVGLLQLEGLTLPPSCVNGYPFSTDVGVLGLASGVWLLALATATLLRYLPESKVWRRAVFLFVSLAVYLHPTASASALRLLDCRSVQLSATAVAALEDSSGDSAASSTTQGFSASPALTTVSVVASNPLVPCLGRLHAPAGGFAAAVLLVYVAAMPAITFFWLWYDDRLLHELRALMRATATSTDPCKSSPSDAIASIESPSQPPPVLPRAVPMLFPFLGGSDYGTAAWYWRHVDIVVVFGLSATNALLPTPASILETAAKFSVTVALLGTLALLLIALPNPYRQQWKRPVRLSLVALSSACAAINAGSRALDLGYGGPGLAAAIAPGGYAILCLTAITLVTLIVGFAYGVFSKALEAERVRIASIARLTEAAPSAIAGPACSAADDIAAGAASIETPQTHRDAPSSNGLVSPRTGEVLLQASVDGEQSNEDDVTIMVSDVVIREREAHRGAATQRADYASGPLSFVVGKRYLATPAAPVIRADTAPPFLLETARDLATPSNSASTWHVPAEADSGRQVPALHTPSTLAVPTARGDAATPPGHSPARAHPTPPDMSRWEGFVHDPFELDANRARRNVSAAACADPLAGGDLPSLEAGAAPSRADPRQHLRRSIAGARRLSLENARTRTSLPSSPSCPGGSSTAGTSATLQAMWMQRQQPIPQAVEARRLETADQLPVPRLARRSLPASQMQAQRSQAVDAGVSDNGVGGRPPGTVVRARRASESAGLVRHPLASPATFQQPSVPAAYEQRRRSFLLASALFSIQSPLGGAQSSPGLGGVSADI